MEEVAMWNCQHKMFVYSRITPESKQNWSVIWQYLLIFRLKTIDLINIWVPMMYIMPQTVVCESVCLWAGAAMCVCSTAEQCTSAVVRKQAVSIQLWQLHQGSLKVAVNHDKSSHPSALQGPLSTTTNMTGSYSSIYSCTPSLWQWVCN